MLITTWVALLWVLAAVGGPGAATEALASNPDTDGFLSLGSDYYTVPWILSTAITIGFGVAMFPQVNQRFFAAGSKTVLKRSFALWPILCVLLFVPSFMLGTWAAGLGSRSQRARTSCRWSSRSTRRRGSPRWSSPARWPR